MRTGVSLRFHSLTERLAQADIEPSVGSLGNSDDNALAETNNGLCKARIDLPPCAMENQVSTGAGHPAVDDLVQPSQTAELDWVYSTG